MKKEYKKPQIIIEKFELNDYIASCNVRDISLDVNGCKIPDWIANNENLLDYWDFGLFTNKCEQVGGAYDDLELGEICYQAPSATNIIISS